MLILLVAITRVKVMLVVVAIMNKFSGHIEISLFKYTFVLRYNILCKSEKNCTTTYDFFSLSLDS